MRAIMLALLGTGCATAPDASFLGTPRCDATERTDVARDEDGVIRRDLDADVDALPGPVADVLDCCDHAAIFVAWPLGAYRLRVDGVIEDTCRFEVTTTVEDGDAQRWSCASNGASSWDVWSTASGDAPSIAGFRERCELGE